MAALPVCAVALVACSACSLRSHPVQQANARKPSASERCFLAWNAPGNAGRQMRVAAGKLEVASVSASYLSASRPFNAPGANRLDTRRGCGFLFHSDRRYLSFGGVWQGAALRFGVPPAIHGRWSDRQEANQADNALVHSGGRLRVLHPPRWPPPASGQTRLPAAWIETRTGPRWLSYSTYCWPSFGCADYAATSCADPKLLRLRFRRGERVQFHLPYEPPRAVLELYGRGRPREAPKERPLHAARTISWIVSNDGVYVLSTGRGSIGAGNYTACIRLSR